MIQLLTLRQRLTELGYKLEMSGNALNKLAEIGFDPVYGARPLKRAIQQWIENPLAEKLLSGSIVHGHVVSLDVEDGEFVF